MQPSIGNEVREALASLDAETAAVQRVTGITCPTGCGLCCLTPAVETNVLEMLPMAIELFRRGAGETWLERLRAPDELAICPVYEPSTESLERGRCGMYAWRPSVCRLYGYAGRKNRHGRPELVACPEHERETPELVERARALVEAGLTLPLFSSVAFQLASLDPALGSERLPIRRALERALEVVGLEMHLAVLDRTANASAPNGVSCRAGGESQAPLTPAERP
jgi:Fe-S-cluster containining protein